MGQNGWPSFHLPSKRAPPPRRRHLAAANILAGKSKAAPGAYEIFRGEYRIDGIFWQADFRDKISLGRVSPPRYIRDRYYKHEPSVTKSKEKIWKQISLWLSSNGRVRQVCSACDDAVGVVYIWRHLYGKPIVKNHGMITGKQGVIKPPIPSRELFISVTSHDRMPIQKRASGSSSTRFTNHSTSNRWRHRLHRRITRRRPQLTLVMYDGN